MYKNYMEKYDPDAPNNIIKEERATHQKEKLVESQLDKLRYNAYRCSYLDSNNTIWSIKVSTMADSVTICITFGFFTLWSLPVILFRQH